MPPTTRAIETSLDHRNESDASANTFPSSEQKSLPALVVCFLLPAEHLEDLVSTLKGIAANPQSTTTPLCSSYETTASTSNVAWFTHFEAARYLGISTSTLYRYAEQERIECRKTGNRLEYRRPALDQFKENQIRPPSPLTASGYNPFDAQLRQVRGAPVGLYKRNDSRYWWISYTWKGRQRFASTKTTSKALAKKILERREGEIAMQMFNLCRQGDRMSFKQLCDEFDGAHVQTLAKHTQTNVRIFLENMRTFFGDRSLADIDSKLVTDYRNYRKEQPSKKNPTKKIKGATVNRKLECLQCMLEYAVSRKYLTENPASGVKHFDERRERPTKRMLALEEEQRILANAPPYLRVAIVLLAQTGGRTYTEGLSLRWDQIDLENRVIYFGGQTKTEGSSEPVPLTKLAHDVLVRWKKKQGDKSQFLFPSPVKPGQPIASVKRAWKTTLKSAKVAHFPIYNLRHVFCTRLSWVAPDTVVQRAMRHASPETKRHYQLGMVEQVRQNLEKANQRVYGRGKVLRFHDVPPTAEISEEAVVRK